MRFPLFLAASLLGFAPLGLHAGEKKLPPVTIRLHGEGNQKEGDSFVSEIELKFPAKKIYIRKVPVITERDIKSFLPFPGENGMVGAYFRLDPHGADKLQQYTTEDRGRLAVVLVNGRVACVLQVVKPVTDGILYVKSGLQPEEIPRLAQKYPVIGRETEFGKKPKPEKPIAPPAKEKKP